MLSVTAGISQMIRLQLTLCQIDLEHT